MLSLLLLATPLPALGQDEDFRSTARLRFGPLYLTPSLAITNFGVDTNVFNAVADPKSDFVISLGPHLDAWLPLSRRVVLESAFTGGIDYFQKFSSERSFNPDASGQVVVLLNRLRLFGGGSYLNSRQRPNFEIDARSRRVVDGYHAGFEVQAREKLFIEVSGRQQRLAYDADAEFLGTSLRETLNREERVATVAASWRRNVLTTIRGTLEAQTYRFDFSPERDADSLLATVGAAFHPRALISGDGYVGVRRFEGLGPRVPGFAGTVASARLSYEWRGSTTLSYTAERDIDFSYDPQQAYYVLWLS